MSASGLPGPKIPLTDPARVALLVFGHGTSDGRGTVVARGIAGRIATFGLFGRVEACFLRQAPSVPDALRALAGHPRIVLVPLLAGGGGLAREVLPALVRQAGPLAARVMLCSPVGRHPLIARLVTARATAILRREGMTPHQAAVVIVGHGNAADPEAAAGIRALAGAVSAAEPFGTVACVFLAEPPLAENWRQLVDQPNVIIVPFLFSGGHHEDRDLPARLRVSASGMPLAGEPSAGRRVWLTGSIGRDPALTRIVLDLAVKALAAPDGQQPVPGPEPGTEIARYGAEAAINQLWPLNLGR